MFKYMFLALLVAAVITASRAVFRFMFKQALLQVIENFRTHQSVSLDKAITLEELGIRTDSCLRGAGLVRDYKPIALQALIEYDVVRFTDENRLYMSEEKMSDLLNGFFDRNPTQDHP